MKTSVGLFGFGKTGSAVAKEIIEDKRFNLQWVLRKSDKDEGKFASRLLGYGFNEGRIHSVQNTDFNHFYRENRVDVIIDFSTSNSLSEYENAACNGIRIVSAISNYSKTEFEQLKIYSNETAVLYSPNITLGINLLISACKLLQNVVPNADIEIIEEHFKDKKGISGTAIRIAEYLGLNQESQVNSIRVGGIVGTHEVVFGLPNQTIRIKHESLDRAAFGQGAIYAANWIMKKERSLYSMEDAVSSLMMQA